MDAYKPLKGYSKGILEDVLSEERSAVMLEMLTQFDEKSYEEGLREEGREEARYEDVEKIIASGAFDAAKACEILGVELDAYNEHLKEIKTT